MKNNDEKSPRMVIISEKIIESQRMDYDPLEEEIVSLKLTSNLLKEMSFNSTVNKFDYFEKLIQQQNNRFNQKLNKSITNQKEVIRKIKAVQKSCKQIKNQTNNFNYSKVHVQLEQLRTTKQQTNKYQKLSQGMIKYLEQINQKLNNM